MYADATATAVDMYPQHGFDEISEVIVDLGKWGRESVKLHRPVAFIRETRGKEAEWLRK